MSSHQQDWFIRPGKRFGAEALIKIGVLLLIPALLTGCAELAPMAAPVLSASGAGNATVQSQTMVSLSVNNFVVTKTNIVGTSKGFSLLGLIPIYPARLNTAMSRLYGKSGIEPGSTKALANLNIERSSTYWILFSIPETSVRAQVVEFKSAVAATNCPAITPEKY